MAPHLRIPSAGRSQHTPSITSAHRSPSPPPLRPAEAAPVGLGGRDLPPASDFPEPDFLLGLWCRLSPAAPTRTAPSGPSSPAPQGTRAALTCVQGDVGGVDHFELQAGEENSPLGKNERRRRPSGRVAGARDAAAQPQAPSDASSSILSPQKPALVPAPTPQEGSTGEDRSCPSTAPGPSPAFIPGDLGLAGTPRLVRKGKAPGGGTQAHAASPSGLPRSRPFGLGERSREATAPIRRAPSPAPPPLLPAPRSGAA